MLTIVVTPPILVGYEIKYSDCDLNNPEWLRKQDRLNKTIYVVPSSDDGYFRRQIMEPFINPDGIYAAGYLNEDMLGKEWMKDGINYKVESLYNTHEYYRYVERLSRFIRRDNRMGEFELRNNWTYKR